jgi:hypothetical protein
VSWRLVSDKVDGQMAIVDITMVPRDQVLWPTVIMLAGRTLDEHVRDA